MYPVYQCIIIGGIDLIFIKPTPFVKYIRYIQSDRAHGVFIINRSEFSRSLLCLYRIIVQSPAKP